MANVKKKKIPADSFKKWSTIFLILAFVCQILSVIFTMLPWCYDSRGVVTGYHAHSSPYLYDGWAGKINIGVGIVLILLFFGVLREVDSPTTLYYASFLVGWNIFMSTWLIIVMNPMDSLMKFGLPMTIGATFAVFCFSLASILTRNSQLPPSPTKKIDEYESEY